MSRKSSRKRKSQDDEDFDPDSRAPFAMDSESPRRSGRPRKVRHVIMDDYDDNEETVVPKQEPMDESEEASSTLPVVEATEEVMVKEEQPDVEETIQLTLDPVAVVKEEPIPLISDDPLSEEKRKEPKEMEELCADALQHILNECIEYVVDEVKLLVRHKSAHNPKIYLMCPVCGSLETIRNLGTHLNLNHQAGFLRCPGKKCLGYRVKYAELADHIQGHHFIVRCEYCHQNFGVKKLKFHQNICQGTTKKGPIIIQAHSKSIPTLQKKTDGNRAVVAVKQPALRPVLQAKPMGITLQKPQGMLQSSHGQATDKPTTVILRPRNEQSLFPNSRPNVVMLNQPSSRLQPSRADLQQAATLLNASSRYEVLLCGKLVIIDDIYYYVKGDVTFVDCPLCDDKSMALSVIGSHLNTEHKVQGITCCAKECAELVRTNVFQEHLIEKHGKIKCRACSFILGILNAKDHFDNQGKCMKNRPQSGVGPLLVKNPGIGGRMLNYDVNGLTPSVSSLQQNEPFVAELTIVDESSQASAKHTLLEKFDESQGGKIPTLPCPHCGKQCSYLKKHIRDVHQPKTNCPICGRKMGHSYLSEHMKIQHQGKEVPTKQCPLCMVVVQKLKNHLKSTHKMTKRTADEVYEKYCPMTEKNQAISKTQTQSAAIERDRKYAKLSGEGLPVPETMMTVEDRVLVFDD